MSKKLNKLVDINGLREFKNKLVGTDSAYVQTTAVDQTIAGTKTFSKPIVGSVTGSSGSCTGNAASANIATKATQDAAGNTITTTYATKAENNTKANNSEVVHKSGDETIAGTKTFSNGVLLTDANAFMAQNGEYTLVLRNDSRDTYLLMSDKGGVPGTWSDARPLIINNSTGVCSINGNASTATTATNATYANWLRTSSHSDHLFHTEWDGRYFWTYVTAGDGGYRAVRVERSNSSGYADSAGNGVPAGVIIPFAGTSVPTGYLLCNGAAVSRTNYANLFAVIGTRYGAGNGSTTFNLPDARDRVLQGASGTHSVGSYIAAGLPNITGGVLNGGGYFCYGDCYGAFSLVGATSPAQASNSGGMRWANFEFNAHKSNALYGASNTVQSPAIATNFIIKY